MCDRCARTVLALLVALATLTGGQVLAQQSVVDHYRTKDGLPNSLVKFSVQDASGFVWLATDGGLVRFDGVNFETFTTANGLHSNSVKSIFANSRGRLFVITDLGISEVIRTTTGTTFTSLARASSAVQDSLLFYPKKMIEDRAGNLWVSDARGLMRLSAAGQRRYTLPPHSWPDSFVRSYSLIEDDLGQLIAISERGCVFFLDTNDDRFVELMTPVDFVQSNTALLRADGSIWVGGAYGIHSFQITDKHQVADWTLVTKDDDIMDIVDLGDGRLVAGTSGNGLLVLSQDETGWNARSFASEKIEVVHDVALDSDGNLFAATDDGLAIVRPSYFTSVIDFKSTAIQSTAAGQRDEVFGIHETNYVRLTRNRTGSIGRTMFVTDEVLTALATDGVTHWAGSANGTVYRYRSDVLSSFRLDSRQAVASMAIDGNGDVWINHFKATDVARVATDGTVRYYGPEHGISSTVNAVRYLQEDIYATGSGSSFLFRYNEAEDRFEDISQPLTFETRTDITVNDVDIDHDGNLWLGSSDGLLAVRSGSVSKLPGSHALASEEVRALAHDRFGHTWIGTGRGLYRYTAGQISQFNDDPGIGNPTINFRSIAVDSEQRVWVGHYAGISYWSRRPGETTVTPRPVLLGVSVDGDLVDASNNQISVSHGSLVEADLVALSFPGRNILYQTRVGSSPGAWSTPRPEAHIHFSNAMSGEHLVQVRAQQDGYLWSAPTEIRFSVALPWYREWWAVGLFLAASIALIVLMWVGQDRIRTMQLRTQNQKLERLVTKRTKELHDQKTMIEATNLELKKVLERNHEFLGIAAHDLRNPLTSLIGFSELLLDSIDKMRPADFVEKGAEVLPIIHRAATTMQGVIQDLLDAQLVERADGNLRVEDIDFVQMTRSVVDMNAVASRRKGITLTFLPQGVYRAAADRRGMQRVLDNLISNAVKYSPGGSEVTIRLEHTGHSLRISVSDEGPGLTEEDKSKVFGKLQRLSARPTGGETSTGLGLYIASSVVEMHGGTIGVDSVPGQGAEFWLEIPAQQALAAA
jgi:signal transduction histidine kinase/sugar lactone lactonase YvrE